MTYDITKTTAPALPKLGRAQNAYNYCSKRPEKAYVPPSF